MAMTKRYLVVLLLCLTALTWADELVRASKMRSEGIDLFSFQPIRFSNQGRVLAGFDRAPFELKKKGIFFRLWFFQFGVDCRLEGIRSVDLSVPSLDQGSFSPDDRYFVIISNAGTQITAVDTETLEVRDIVRYQKGQPGFRAQPTVMWVEGNRLFVTGHHYDAERYAEENTIAQLDASRTGAEAFTAGTNIFRFERSIKNKEFLNYNSDQLGFAVNKSGDRSKLSVWDGESLEQLDESTQFHGFWGEGTRFLYACERPGQNELILYDALEERQWKIGSADRPFRYLFLSKDATTAIGCQLDSVAQRMDIHVAKERDDFVANVPETLKDVKLGWLRLSSDGRYLVHFTEKGLRCVELR